MGDTTPRTDQQIGEALKPLADAIRNAIRTKFILGDPLDFLVAEITIAVARELGSLVREDNEEHRRLNAQVAAAYAFADEMADYCSPHGVSVDYAKTLRQRLNNAATSQPNQDAQYAFNARSVNRLTKHILAAEGRTLCDRQATSPMGAALAESLPLCGFCRRLAEEQQ